VFSEERAQGRHFWSFPATIPTKNPAGLLRAAMNSTFEHSPSDSFRIVRPRLPLPAMRGVIDRRMLLNFRCEPAALQRCLPAPFRPKLVHGWGLAGICLLRLNELRPRWISTPLGLRSENAAHRIAVEWDETGQRREGVFIPRRDTDLRLKHLAGSRLFPGVHHFARFDVCESPNRFKLDMRSEDGEARVRVIARVAEAWPGASVFANLEEASAFFAAGSLGWSVGNEPGELDGLELRSFGWHMEPLIVERVESSFFDNMNGFRLGTVQFDSALLMRGIQHEWHARGQMLCCGASPTP